MNKKEKFKNIFEWLYCIIIAIILAILFRYYIGTPTIVKQTSMYPTLQEGQRLWLNRWNRTTHKMPKRGDIITFEAPKKLILEESEIDIANPIAQYSDQIGLNWFFYNFLEIGKTSFIKRVVALPGEHVKIENGSVYINNDKIDEKYLPDGTKTYVHKSEIESGYDDFIVPNNCVFAMGDNRGGSKDCRNFGCIPFDKIESNVLIRIWPLNLFGKI